jgi:nucleoside-diphosphate-sugar epimerase
MHGEARNTAPDSALPEAITDEEQLEDWLSRPSPAALAQLARLEGDLLVLGVGGKMGPTLARMAARGLAEIGSPHRVVGVARFSQPDLRGQLEQWGVRTIAADLLDRAALAALPDARQIIFMAGQKFGTTGNASQTWAMNCILPALVAERYSAAQIVVFSTGNVYPLTPIAHGGAAESLPPDPVGEYAMSCLGRERVFAHFAATRGLRCAIMRLCYALDLRYGVLLDIATKVRAGRPVDVSMGAANVIWQGDANAQALALLGCCSAPPFVLNVTGPETVSVRWLAQQFGALFGVEPVLVGEEAPTALLANTAEAVRLFGYPRVPLAQLVRWTAAWVEAGGTTWQKPTHFEVRDGRF